MTRLLVLIIFLAHSALSAQESVIQAATGSVVTSESTTDVVAKGVEKKENLWKTLSKITYKKEYDEFLGFKIDKPVFADVVRELEDEEVEVRGYIIPVEGYKSHTEFIFSAYPYSMCFFCGGAGPETVMEVEASEPVEYTAEQVVLTGKLKLNPDDINRLMYLLVDAKLVKDK